MTEISNVINCVNTVIYKIKDNNFDDFYSYPALPYDLDLHETFAYKIYNIYPLSFNEINIDNFDFTVHTSIPNNVSIGTKDNIEILHAKIVLDFLLYDNFKFFLDRNLKYFAINNVNLNNDFYTNYGFCLMSLNNNNILQSISFITDGNTENWRHRMKRLLKKGKNVNFTSI